MKIIPAIDIIDGKCVRLTQGNYSQCKIYSESPLEVAKMFQDNGITRIHVVDLDGAKAAGVVHVRVLESICAHTSLSVDFGGGIKTDADIVKVFEAGADYACIGSIAQINVEKTKGWLEKFGKDRMIIGADVWNTKVCVQGWKKVTDTTIYDLIEIYKDQIQHLMCTDITRDGMLEGPALNLYKDLMERYPHIHFIASGGVGGYEDLERLAELGVESVIVGKAFYENKINVTNVMNVYNECSK